MNSFNTPAFMAAVYALSVMEANLGIIVRMGNGNRRLETDKYEKMMSNINWAREQCTEAKFADSCHRIDLVVSHLEDPEKVNLSIAYAEIRNIGESIMVDAHNRKFLQIMEDRAQYVDQEALFGEQVNKSFPSSMRDIKEAGNCFAAECTTGCVFHLMRSAEVTMRALAKDRRVEFADKPLEQKEWGQILDNLDSKIKALRQEPLATWKIPQAKDEQIRFYAEVAQELRAFNEAWRKHLSHADTKAFYDRDQALSIMNHVRSFMQQLATRISEDEITEFYWEEL